MDNTFLLHTISPTTSSNFAQMQWSVEEITRILSRQGEKECKQSFLTASDKKKINSSLLFIFSYQ